jgi:hypothetical protein
VDSFLIYLLFLKIPIQAIKWAGFVTCFDLFCKNNSHNNGSFYRYTMQSLRMVLYLRYHHQQIGSFLIGLTHSIASYKYQDTKRLFHQDALQPKRKIPVIINRAGCGVRSKIQRLIDGVFYNSSWSFLSKTNQVIFSSLLKVHRCIFCIFNQ